MIHVLRAGLMHTNSMAEILNEIINDGTSSALTETVSGQSLAERMFNVSRRSTWHVAENDAGCVLGFQWIEPSESLPPDAVDIATFSKTGCTGHGIGTALFDATLLAARELGYVWINANIRADNIGGLAYYQSRGFEDYGRIEDVKLANGQIVDKVLKRYDL